MFSQQLMTLTEIGPFSLWFLYNLYFPWWVHISLLYNEDNFVTSYIYKQDMPYLHKSRKHILGNHFINYISSLPDYSHLKKLINKLSNHDLPPKSILSYKISNKHLKNYSLLHIHVQVIL